MKMFGPFVELARLQNEINKVFESFLEVSPEESVKAASGWMPSVDVFQHDEKIIVHVELPGVDPVSVRLAVESGRIFIEGDKPRARTVPGARYHCLERGHGGFSRSINLPVPVNTHQAKAVIKEGLLTVIFPRVSNRRGEAVPVPVEAE